MNSNDIEVQNLIKKYLEKNNILNLETENQFVAIAKLVSKIPWGEARTIPTVLELNKGTCTGKHFLLQACFDELKIEYIPVACTFKWKDENIQYPKNLQEILDNFEWEHGHNFVKVKNHKKNWIDLDITWDPDLQKFGFPTLPKNWDGTTDHIEVNQIIQRWDKANIKEKKKELIDSLSPETKNAREKFLNEFIKWIDSLR